MVRGQWILGGFCGFQVRTRRDHLSLRERGVGIKGGDFGKLTSNDKGSSVYCRIPWHNQNSPISPPTIHYLLPCSEMSEDFGGIPWFSGGNSGDHHCRGGVWRDGTLENWLQMRGDHQNTAEPCETTKILWLHPPPAPPQAVNNNDQSLIKYLTALSPTLLSTVQKKNYNKLNHHDKWSCVFLKTFQVKIHALLENLTQQFFQPLQLKHTETETGGFARSRKFSFKSLRKYIA